MGTRRGAVKHGVVEGGGLPWHTQGGTGREGGGDDPTQDGGDILFGGQNDWPNSGGSSDYDLS